MSRMNSVFVVTLAVLALLVGTAGVAQALVYAPSYADANSTDSKHTCNSLGVDPLTGVTELTLVDPNDVMTWTHSPEPSAWGQYDSSSTLKLSTIWVDLADPMQISKVYLWNGHQNNLAGGNCLGRSVKDFELYTSTGRDNTGYTWQYTGVLTQPTFGLPTPTQAFTFTSPVTARYIRININSTWDIPGTVQTVAGLSEVRFEATKLASSIITPISATASSYLTGYQAPQHALPKRLIDGGLMNEPGLDLSQWTLEATTHSLAPGSSTKDDQASAWVSTSGTVANQWVRFDLGSAQDLGKIHLWNLNVAGQTGFDAKNLEVWSCDSSGNNLALLATITSLPQADGVSKYTDQAFSLSGATGVQYVKLCNFTNWAGTTTGQVGLSEVRFNLVPEPGTLALLAAGLIGLLCYAWRKRK